MEVLAWGFGILEAPVVGDDGEIIFTDLAGGIYRLAPGGTAETILPGRRGIGGLVRHADGGLLLTGRSLARLGSDGATTEILSATGPAASPAMAGAAGLNDMHVAPDGSVLVGVLRYRPLAGDAPVPGAILRLRAGAEPTALPTETLWWPNGIGISPDGSLVYIADFHTGTVHRGPLDGPEGIGPWVTTPSGQADGLAVDEEGAVLVALGNGGGVARYRADGTLADVVEVPAKFVSSVAFGGHDRRDLLITTAENTADPDRGGTLFRTRAAVPGMPVPLATL